ncbi:hypothetical protein B0H10DRAFT_1951494 [Mycena sp. CBHHK59/15]|nr:hypothetical protein B0H10DRAFT_1951494 [Mycena sp. CBHHK59/15]
MDYVCLPPICIPAHAASPKAFEPEDEEDFVNADEDDYVGQPLQNPISGGMGNNGHRTMDSYGDLPPASQERSMVSQTLRSFKNHTSTAKPSQAGGSARSSNPKNFVGFALICTSSVVTFDDVAPSDWEIYTQAEMLPPVKGERVAQYHERTSENELCMCTWVLQINRHIHELQEILMMSPESPPDHSADITRLKALLAEGCSTVSNLTECVKDLVNLPVEVASLSRAVWNANARALTLASTSGRPTGPFLAVTERAQSGPAVSMKRKVPFEGYGEPISKHLKPDNIHFFDVYLWDIQVSPHISPAKIAHMVMQDLGMDSSNTFCSVVPPVHLPSTVISICFHRADVGQMFIDRLCDNPRPDRPGIQQAWGGVALVIRIGIEYTLCTELCTLDLAVLDLHNIFLIDGLNGWTQIQKLNLAKQ